MYAERRGNVEARWYSSFWTKAIERGLLPRRWVVLEVTGRRSGRTVAFPLGMADIGSRWYLVSMLGENCNWVRNVRAAGGVVALRRRRPVACQLTEVPVARRPPILRRYVEVAPGGRPHIAVDRRAPVSEFARIAADHPIFLVEPLDVSGRP